MKLMKLVFLRHILPRSIRQDLRSRWDLMLRREAVAIELSFYRSIVRENNLVFDVGANIGFKNRCIFLFGSPCDRDRAKSSMHRNYSAQWC